MEILKYGMWENISPENYWLHYLNQKKSEYHFKLMIKAKRLLFLLKDKKYLYEIYNSL